MTQQLSSVLCSETGKVSSMAPTPDVPDLVTITNLQKE